MAITIFIKFCIFIVHSRLNHLMNVVPIRYLGSPYKYHQLIFLPTLKIQISLHKKQGNEVSNQHGVYKHVQLFPLLCY